MTRMQLIRTLAAWRPDLSDYRNLSSAYRITLKSLGRRYLELHDEIADLDVMIASLVDELAPDLVSRPSIGYESASQLLLTAGDNSDRLQSEASHRCVPCLELTMDTTYIGKYNDKSAGSNSRPWAFLDSVAAIKNPRIQ